MTTTVDRSPDHQQLIPCADGILGRYASLNSRLTLLRTLAGSTVAPFVPVTQRGWHHWRRNCGPRRNRLHELRYQLINNSRSQWAGPVGSIVPPVSRPDLADLSTPRLRARALEYRTMAAQSVSSAMEASLLRLAHRFDALAMESEATKQA
jgi:hypothetical protein